MKRRTMAFGGLLMAVAITGYSVAGTYAKYISAFDMADEARVAKWDFNDKAENTVDLFQASYTLTNDAGETYTYVASKDASKVVAPGTSGTYEYDITGTAETNFKVTKTIKVLNKIALVGDYKIENGLEGEWEKGKIYYNPIEFSIDGGNTWVEATEFNYDDAGKFIGLSVDFKLDDEAIYPANYELNGEAQGTIQWRWNFETTKVSNPNLNSYNNDALDTLLAQEADKNGLTMTATIGVVVEQTKDEATVVPEDGKVVSTTARVTNRLSNADLKQVLSLMGYDSLNSSSVVFNGKEIKGTIYKTDNKYTDRFMGDVSTGYYYPIVVTADDAASIKVTYSTVNDQESYTYSAAQLENGNTLANIYGLKKGENVTFEITYNSGKIETVVVSTENLTFE